MNNVEGYKEMFSKIKSNVEVNTESFERRRPRHLIKGAAAAAVCLLACSTVVAYAFDLFDIRSYVLGDKIQVEIPVEREGADPDEAFDMEYKDVDIIMNQPTETDEYKAALDWRTFFDQFEADGRLEAALAEENNDISMAYEAYPVYNQEMADKLEEIAQSYGLRLMTGLQLIESEEQLYQLTGKEAFLGENNVCGSGYVYDDGTFQYDGEMNLEGGRGLYYQLRNSMKGTLDTVFLNIGDANDYTEKVFETASGVAVNVASSADKVVVTVPLENSTVSLNILLGMSVETVEVESEGAEMVEFTDADVEALINSIDFMKLN